jgi:hypothetical protein
MFEPGTMVIITRTTVDNRVGAICEVIKSGSYSTSFKFITCPHKPQSIGKVGSASTHKFDLYHMSNKEAIKNLKRW